MATLIPEDPRFATQSEQEVWERLRDSLRPCDTLIANSHWVDDRDHELDLVVVMPEVGVTVVEVKGAGTGIEDGHWYLTHGSERRSIDPVRQAREGKFTLRDFVERDRRWAESSRGKVRYSHAVVTPFTSLGQIDLPDLPRWMLHDRDDMPQLAERLRCFPHGFETHRPAPSADDCELIVEIITSRGIDAQPSVVDHADERAARAHRLTQEQSLILKVTRLLNRVEIRGGAGSGKTVLALTQAQQLAAGRDGRPRQRVALICYSIGLATHLQRETKEWPHKQRPAFVGTFEDLANMWGIESGSRDDHAFWEERLPVLMAERAEALPPNQRFDSFVVDEAQDFAESWWRPLIAALTDEEDGGLFVYSDEGQRLFERYGRPPVPLVPLVLDHNLRNTRQIASVFRSLAPRMRLEGGDGPQVEHLQATPQEAMDVADDAVERLHDEGWHPGHIALLSTGKRHPEQAALQEALGQGGYWATFWDGQYSFYGHVLGFKGLERRAVVLCVNEDGTRERFRERLYVGLSRATDRLIVVGDLAAIANAGDDQLVKALWAVSRPPN